MGPHVPLIPPVFAFEHARQRPVHILSQQTPSAQKPLKHELPPLHVCPFSSSQSAPVLHETVGPVHIPSSVPLGTSAHVPTLPAILHARHVVVHVSLQQTPSTQLVLTQSPPAAHVLPRDFLHVPLPSHASLPLTLHGELTAVDGFEGLPCGSQRSCVH